MKNYKKIIAAVLVVAIVASCAVGATLAWLQDKTTTVTNTFSPSTINIELEETTGDTYKMIPDTEIAKNPKAWVETGSEECYLFVKITESDNFDTFMEYGIADGWTTHSASEKEVVIYRIFDAEHSENVMGTEYSILAGDKVTVKEDVTKSMMDGLTSNPTLSFTAYAIQTAGMNSVGEAWTAAQAQ